MSVNRNPLPTLSALVFIAVLAFVVFLFQEPLLNSDGDLARHLRHGEYMIQHHTLIHADPFSFTRPGQPFTPFEYGSQLIFAAVHRVGGMAGITVLAGLLLATAYALLARYLERRGVEPLLVIGVVVAAVATGLGHWLARPHLMTFVAVPILLELLTPLRKFRLWPFVLLFAIWANVHGGFVYGLVLIGLFAIAAAIEPALPRQERVAKVRFYALAFVLSAAATLATPLGLSLHRHVVAALGETYVLNHASEFASPDFHLTSTKLFLWVLLAALAAAMRNPRGVSIRSVLLLLAGIDFALVYQRNVSLFGLTALPVLALDLDGRWREIRLFRKLRAGIEAGAAGASGAGWILAASVAAIVLGVAHGRVGGKQWIADSFDSTRMPVKAVAAARAASLQGRLFADFTYGGYILYAWPEQKVFIDGGVDFYGGDLMRDYSRIRGTRPGWRELVKRWDLSLILVRPAAPVAVELAQDGGWAYWYCDPQAVIVVRLPYPGRLAPSRPGLDARTCSSERDESGS